MEKAFPNQGVIGVGIGWDFVARGLLMLNLRTQLIPRLTEEELFVQLL